MRKWEGKSEEIGSKAGLLKLASFPGLETVRSALSQPAVVTKQNNTILVR